MLPGFLDVQTMRVIMWLIIIVSFIVCLMLIKSLEKPGLRVVTTLIIGALLIGCYQYTRVLTTCEKNNKVCTFLNLKVPKDGGFIN
ncbi:MAG: hypothetical protein U0R17_01875 [Acidimicrobiia bacterium]